MFAPWSPCSRAALALALALAHAGRGGLAACSTGAPRTQRATAPPCAQAAQATPEEAAPQVCDQIVQIKLLGERVLTKRTTLMICAHEDSPLARQFDASDCTEASYSRA